MIALSVDDAMMFFWVQKDTARRGRPCVCLLSGRSSRGVRARHRQTQGLPLRVHDSYKSSSHGPHHQSSRASQAKASYDALGLPILMIVLAGYWTLTLTVVLAPMACAFPPKSLSTAVVGIV